MKNRNNSPGAWIGLSHPWRRQLHILGDTHSCFNREPHRRKMPTDRWRDHRFEPGTARDDLQNTETPRRRDWTYSISQDVCIPSEIESNVPDLIFTSWAEVGRPFTE